MLAQGVSPGLESYAPSGLVFSRGIVTQGVSPELKAEREEKRWKGERTFRSVPDVAFVVFDFVFLQKVFQFLLKRTLPVVLGLIANVLDDPRSV